jgi:cytoskeletal protein CcmA (bactofilin family)
MWTNNKEASGQPQPTSPESRFPSTPPGVTPNVRPAAPVARDLACLGSTLRIKGQILGDEDLQIDGKVEGPISLQGHRLTVGRTATLNSEVTAREVVVYGKASGNLCARDRVEIKKDGEVTGDITTARISIEDGAYFKGRIEIAKSESKPQSKFENKSEANANPQVAEVPVAAVTT